MSTRSADAESREHSPDGEPEKRASKKRKVLSCYACRSRKMKCDRIYPVCGRCQKTGRADQCTYDPRLLDDLPVNGDGHVDGGSTGFTLPDRSIHDNPSSTLGSSETLAWKLRVQERRLELLEKRLAQVDRGNASFEASPSHLEDVQTEEPTMKESTVFRGKGFKTKFHGSTSPFSIVAQFNELISFTREAFFLDTSHASIARIRSDFEGFRTRRKAAAKEKGPKLQVTDEEIFALIPEKSVSDSQVSLYFQTWETSYRILHEPTFWKEYHAFWNRQPGEEIPTSFAATLVLIIAITKCLYPKDDNVFIGDSSADRETASNLITSCDTWLLRQNRKHLTLPYFQLQCLSLLAKRVNCLKVKQDWVHSGDVVRLAIASGLHRNPAMLMWGRASEYEKEMRRRLWVTIMEFELQSSIDCGLQSSLCGLHFDSQPPANLPDESFSPDSQQIAASRPAEHFTSASYLSATLRSLPLRIHLMQLLNNPNANLQYADIIHYDSQITSMLSSVPSWGDPRAAVSNALLDLQLRQFLLLLHRPYAKIAAKNHRFTYSFTATIDAANAILSIHDSLNSKGILALSHLRNDVSRTGFTLAQVLYYNCNLPPSIGKATATGPVAPTPASSATGSHDTPGVAGADNWKGYLYQVPPGRELPMPQLPTNNFLLTTLITTGISLLERASTLLEHKVMRLGTGYMEYWLLCAGIGMLPSATNAPVTSISSITNSSPDDMRMRGKRASERLVGLCFRILAMQADPGGNFASTLRTTIAEGSTPTADLRTPNSNAMFGTGGTPMGSGIDPSMPTVIPGLSGMVTAIEEGKSFGGQSGTPGGTFDSLQDMNLDASGWMFPDFWDFDMTGAF